MGRAAGRETAAPGPPRRAATAPLTIPGSGGGGSSHGYGRAALGRGLESDDVRSVAAAAAAEAAAAAADFGTSPTTSDVSSVAGSNVSTYVPPHVAHGEAVETLYSHPSAKILSFTAGPRSSALDNIGSAASRGAAGQGGRGSGGSSSRRSSVSEASIAPGTLPWSSRFDRTIAVGALSIYRAPGSVAFLSCGSALQPILPKSQCWCIDQESSKFILQIRRPQYWRIEVPVGDDGENDERARRLRDVLDHILQFEKTPCPFKRDFTVELPEQPSAPLKKKPWTPVKRPDGDLSSSAAAVGPSPGAPAPSHLPHTPQPSTLTEEADEDGDGDGDGDDHGPASPSLRAQAHRQRTVSPSGASATQTAPPTGFSRREWLAMLESQKDGGARAEAVDEFGRKLVPTLVAEHEQRIMDLKASEIEVSKMGSPWHGRGSFSTPSGAKDGGAGPSRDRALSLTADDVPTFQRAAWPSLDRRWREDASDPSTSTADSASPFNSLRSWLSSAGNRTLTTSAPSPSSSIADSLPDVPPSLSSLYGRDGDALSSAMAAADAPPRIRHRATTSSISISHAPPLPPAVSLIAPSHLRNLHRSGRATTRLEAMRRIPGSIINRVFEILLAPPTYLLTLMLRIAARILHGEWRGFAMGKNTDTGESIPVRWDYSDVDDPLGRSTELTRPSDHGDHDDDDCRGRVDRLNVYTEADVDVYTDAEEEEDDDGDDDDDDDAADAVATARGSASLRLKRSTASLSPAASAAVESDSDSDGDTLPGSGGSPIVWTRR